MERGNYISIFTTMKNGKTSPIHVCENFCMMLHTDDDAGVYYKAMTLNELVALRIAGDIDQKSYDLAREHLGEYI